MYYYTVCDIAWIQLPDKLGGMTVAVQGEVLRNLFMPLAWCGAERPNFNRSSLVAIWTKRVKQKEKLELPLDLKCGRI